MVKNLPANADVRDCRFDPWVGKISWRRAQQPIPGFLPRESRRQRSLVGYGLQSCRVRQYRSNLAHTRDVRWTGGENFGAFHCWWQTQEGEVVSLWEPSVSWKGIMTNVHEGCNHRDRHLTQKNVTTAQPVVRSKTGQGENLARLPYPDCNTTDSRAKSHWWNTELPVITRGRGESYSWPRSSHGPWLSRPSTLCCQE